jgi:hypothetical protein
MGNSMSTIINATTTNGVVIQPDNSGSLVLQTNSGTTALTIDTSQNVGIGVTNPGNKLSLPNNAFVSFRNTSAAETGYIGMTTGNLMSFSDKFYTDSDGNVLVGVTSPGSYAAGSAIGTTGYISRSGTGGSFSNNRFNIFWNGSAARLWIDTVDQGSIAISSDYRIKKDIQSQTLTAIDRINEIRPVTYTYADNEVLNWKADGVAREGFIAHELAEVIPSAVDGEKDAENQIQSLKLDALCSVMVKAIQEQQTIINDLKARVEALEAKLG